MTGDPFQLSRFAVAQDADDTYERALSELRAGRKSTHWMWFVFPQIAGLGQSAMSQRFAIHSLAEARAYLAHPVLGGRIRECASVLTKLGGLSAEQIFGAVDGVKLRSSMTLFQLAAPEEGCFGQVLQEYFGGKADPATEALMSQSRG